MADAAGRPDADEAAVTRCLAEARRLYAAADVFRRAGEIAAEQRAQAAAALVSCRFRRLREVLEFLLDLAVPAQSIAAVGP
jgi:hypothetical protein